MAAHRLSRRSAPKFGAKVVPAPLAPADLGEMRFPRSNGGSDRDPIGQEEVFRGSSRCSAHTAIRLANRLADNGIAQSMDSVGDRSAGNLNITGQEVGRRNSGSRCEHGRKLERCRIGGSCAHSGIYVLHCEPATVPSRNWLAGRARMCDASTIDIGKLVVPRRADCELHLLLWRVVADRSRSLRRSHADVLRPADLRITPRIGGRKEPRHEPVRHHQDQPRCGATDRGH